MRGAVARRAALALGSVFLLASLAPLAAQIPGALNLTFIGDIMGHDVNLAMGNYADIYAGVRQELQGDDLTVANLELPVDPTRPVSGYPYFNGNLPYLKAAVEAGVDAFSTANNHAFDGAEEGIFQTLRSIQSIRGSTARALLFSGTRGNPHQPFAPERIVLKGISIGFIGVVQQMNFRGGERYVNVVDYMDDDAVAEFLRLVAEQSRRVDLLIVSYHGDQEYAAEPSARKRLFFHKVLDAGAGIVFSHHPHVVQGYEKVTEGGREKLIMYSMGNFISGMTWLLDPLKPDEAAPTGESYMLSVAVARGPNGCTIDEVSPIPIANYRNARGEMVVARMRDLASGVVGTSPAWQGYWAARLRSMERFLALDPPRSAQN